MSNYEKTIEKYAYKFVNCSEDVPTVENMKNVFSNCVLSPKDNMYNDIANKVIDLRTKN